MRKSVVAGLALLLMVVIGLPVIAQEATPEMTPESTAMMMEVEPWVCPEGFEGQTLSVYNWSTYVAEDTISNFEAACGVTVVYDVFESNEALLSRISQGNPGYDVMHPTDYMVENLITQGLLEPLDLSLIPNLVNVSDTFIDPPFDPDNAYSIPYQWGTIGIGYNLENTGEPITSWEQVFAYEGPVAWLEDPRGMMGNALNLLGYDPNTQDPAQIEEARDYLIERGGNVVAIAQDDGQAQLERGEIDISIEYSGDIFQLMSETGETYGYSIPEEGAQIWTDNLVIAADAPNVPLAHAYIDYILNPQVGADIANYTAYGTPNQAALDAGLILPELLENPGIYPSEETRERLFFVGAAPDAETDYNDAWDEIKVSLAQ